MDGWIKIYRKLKDWEWYQDSNVVHVFIHLLLSAPFADTKKRGTAYKAGQIVTSLVLLAAELDKSYPTILRCIKILTESGAIDTKSTNKKTIITIRNFTKYQQDKTPCYKNNLEQGLEQTLQQGLEQPLQHIYNKNIKNNKKEKNSIYVSAEKSAPQPKPAKKKNTIDIEPLIAELPTAVQDIARMWVDYKRQQFGFSYKNEKSFEIWLKDLYNKSNGDIATMQAIVEQSIANGYKGIFELKKQNQNGNNGTNNRSIQERAARIAEYAFAANGL